MTRICTGDVCVRSNLPSGKVECVLHGTGRMVRRNVERLEVVVVVFELRPFHNLESDSLKQRRDSLEGASDRMQAAARLTTPRQRDIKPFG